MSSYNVNEGEVGLEVVELAANFRDLVGVLRVLGLELGDGPFDLADGVLNTPRGDPYEEGWQAGYEAAEAEKDQTAFETGYAEGYADGFGAGRASAGTASEPVESGGPEPASSIELYGFVLVSEAVPDAILEIRYFSTYNFVGKRISGDEEPIALLTKEAAPALKEASDDLLRREYHACSRI